MGFVTLGIFVFNGNGLAGSIFQMFSHGVISAALFLCVGESMTNAFEKDFGLRWYS